MHQAPFEVLTAFHSQPPWEIGPITASFIDKKTELQGGSSGNLLKVRLTGSDGSVRL